MKDQYFGDVNDYRKYGLLRSLAVSSDLRLGVCWMLTEPDRRKDGGLVSYLDNATKYRHHDAALFDWLRLVVHDEKVRRTARLEASGLLGRATFQSKFLSDNRTEREHYFAECGTRFAGCDLVFFDSHTGLEAKRPRPGQKGSCKYLYWDEVRTAFNAGLSLLLYQHFIRKERTGFIRGLSEKLQQVTRASAVFSFTTPNVLFLLASQGRHAAVFRRQLDAIRSSWGPKQIVASEDPASIAEQPQPSP